MEDINMRNFGTKPNRSRGFTLIELLIVIALVGVAASYEVSNITREQRTTDARVIAEHIYEFQRDSIKYYRSEGSWPANAATLVSGGYIDTIGDYYGTPYSISIDAAKNQYTVDFDTKEKDYPFMLATLLPNVVVSGTSITTTISAPGEEASNEALYPRDGSRPLTGTMDAAGNSITNVNEIGAERVYSPSNPAYDVSPAGTSNLNHIEVNTLKIVSNATVGGSCTTKSIGTSSTGKFVACENGTWKTPGNELPVDSIYIAITTTNPSSTLGYGTWTSFGEGRVLVGQNTSDSNFNSMEATGGAKTHTLINNEMPSHSHEVVVSDNGWPDGSGDRTNNNYWMDEARSRDETGDHLTAATGGGSAFNILQPYITVKMWKRTG